MGSYKTTAFVYGNLFNLQDMMADEAAEADDDDYESEEDTEPMRTETSDGEADSGEAWYLPIKENNKPEVKQLIAFISHPLLQH